MLWRSDKGALTFYMYAVPFLGQMPQWDALATAARARARPPDRPDARAPGGPRQLRRPRQCPRRPRRPRLLRPQTAPTPATVPRAQSAWPIANT